MKPKGDSAPHEEVLDPFCLGLFVVLVSLSNKNEFANASHEVNGEVKQEGRLQYLMHSREDGQHLRAVEVAEQECDVVGVGNRLFHRHQVEASAAGELLSQELEVLLSISAREGSIVILDGPPQTFHIPYQCGQTDCCWLSDRYRGPPEASMSVGYPREELAYLSDRGARSACSEVFPAVSFWIAEDKVVEVLIPCHNHEVLLEGPLRCFAADVGAIVVSIHEAVIWCEGGLLGLKLLLALGGIVRRPLGGRTLQGISWCHDHIASMSCD